MAIHVTEQLGWNVHTYTAPEDGWLVNTHLVELPTQLIAAFPDFGGQALLDHQKRFLFPPRKEMR